MLKHPVANRVLRSFLANLTGQGINVAQQILMIPLFASIWGLPVFGEWTIISTIPNYLGMSDFGLSRAASTNLALMAGEGKKDEANTVFNTSVAAILAFCAIIALIALPLCTLLPFSTWLNLHHLPSREIELTMIFLIISVLMQIVFFAVLGIFCWDGLQAFGSTLSTLQRAAEVVASVAVLLLRQPPWILALTLCVVRGVSIGVVLVCIRIKLPWVTASFRHIQFKYLTKLISPSIGCMLFPCAMAINLQGLVQVVGILFGPEQVVIFTTTRIVTRGLLQWTELIKRAVRIELSVAIGNRDLALASKLFNRTCRLGFWTMLLWSGVLSLMAPFLFRVLLHGKAPFDAHLFFSLIVVVVFNSFWLLAVLVLEATNEVMQFSVEYMAVSIFSIALSYGLMRYFGFETAAFGSIFCDAIMIYVVLGKSLKSLGENAGSFARYVFLPAPRRMPTAIG